METETCSEQCSKFVILLIGNGYLTANLTCSSSSLTGLILRSFSWVGMDLLTTRKQICTGNQENRSCYSNMYHLVCRFSPHHPPTPNHTNCCRCSRLPTLELASSTGYARCFPQTPGPPLWTRAPDTVDGRKGSILNPQIPNNTTTYWNCFTRAQLWHRILPPPRGWTMKSSSPLI